jgi:hypothetical protein
VKSKKKVGAVSSFVYRMDVMEDDCIAQTKSHFEHAEQVSHLVDSLCNGTAEAAGASLNQLSTIVSNFIHSLSKEY